MNLDFITRSFESFLCCQEANNSCKLLTKYICNLITLLLSCSSYMDDTRK